MATTTTNLTNEFATALKCKPQFVATRILALGHGDDCSRCGGTGHYSFNLMTGSVCFKCNGQRRLMPKLTAKLLEIVIREVAEGKMQPYLDRMARKSKVKNAWERLMAAWEANPTTKQWKGTHFTQCPEREHQINAFCAPMADEVSKLAIAVEKGRWNKEIKGYIPLTNEEIETACDRIEECIRLVSQAETLAPNHR